MGKKPASTITKSRFLTGRQCLKRLWITVYQPERIPPPDEAARHRFTEGYLIDRLAKTRFPDGIDIPSENFLENIEQTRDWLARRRPLFEAGFQAGDLSGRADILNPVPGGAWDLIEVKSSTTVKEVHVEDVAFQRHCYKAAGLTIRRTFLMHIDNGYVRRGDIDPDRLLLKEDVTDRVEKTGDGIDAALLPLRRTLASPTCPPIDIGPHCTSPYVCPLYDECWGFLPENNVFTLYHGGPKSLELYQSGVLALKDIPAGWPLSWRQKIQVACAAGGRAHVDGQKIKEFLNTLRHPLSFLDFETFGTAIPPYDHVSPYQPIPFQFSLHVVSAPGAQAVHESFLAQGADDPRPVFLKALMEALPRSGSVVVYNQTFEKSVLAALAAVFPKNTRWVENVINRLADLLVPFRAFYYYHPRQHGSASLKSVLPALTGQSYAGLGISDGLAASREFIYITFGELYGQSVSEKEREDIRRDLLEYCGLDTEAMIRILEKLASRRENR
jgi:hypothetical protein